MQARVMANEERVGVSVGSGSALYWAVSGNLFPGRKLWSAQKSGEWGPARVSPRE